jgi:hypothetical protein
VVELVGAEHDASAIERFCCHDSQGDRRARQAGGVDAARVVLRLTAGSEGETVVNRSTSPCRVESIEG